MTILGELERKVRWLSTWMIHHANHIRPKKEELKVGGHQASSASLTTLMSALYFAVLRPQDRVAVKPHASPVFHAIQYLFGLQSNDNLENFRALAGAQSYPSRTKDADDVDFSTGSVGLGVGLTIFAAILRDYLCVKEMANVENLQLARMVALVGDAELDEGNVYEALYEGAKHEVRNVWWIIDYNRQSLDTITEDRLYDRIDKLFRAMGWNVCILKYGKSLEKAFQQPGGATLRQWIEECPNNLYSALVCKGGNSWRLRLLKDIGNSKGVRSLLDEYDDQGLHQLMTNLGGHDMQSVLEAFHSATDDAPTCFLAYTIKGYGLPLARHKDNHSGQLSSDQVQLYKQECGIKDGEEWELCAGLRIPEQRIQEFLSTVPFMRTAKSAYKAPHVHSVDDIPAPKSKRISTQTGFGRFLNTLASRADDLTESVVTTSPDVAVTTNLGAWVNKRGVFSRQTYKDRFCDEEVSSLQKWSMSPEGQHIELGIAENNLFLLLAALGMSGPLFGKRLIPIGTIYDPFISRGLDALNYACYQDSRFILIGTPSGISLAPEGGAHQSVLEPLIGIGQPGMTYWEPAFVDELAVILNWSFQHLQETDGGSVYLRLSTRMIAQPQRTMTESLRKSILEGGYWLLEPKLNASLAIVCCGAVTPEALAACMDARKENTDVGLLVVTSADRLYRDWSRARKKRRTGNGTEQSPIETLLARLSPHAGIVTILDGHSLTLSWLGSVASHRVVALGVDRFGESGDLIDLYREYELDPKAILTALAQLRSEQ